MAGLARKPASCEGCPAFKVGRGFVKPAGHLKARYLVVGPGPSEDDAYQAKAYFDGGPTGESVTRRVYKAGLQRSDVIFTDLVWCWLPNPKLAGNSRGNRLPTAAEVKYCWSRHLGPYLEALPTLERPRHLFALGPTATRWFKNLKADAPAEVHLGTTERHTLPGVEG